MSSICSLEVWPLRVTFGNVTVMVASLHDIIASKQWANRPKDNAALPELLAIADQLPRDDIES
jgi:hypothetical protein